MTDWKVGDLAVCVNAQPIQCRGAHYLCFHLGADWSDGDVVTVSAVVPSFDDEGVRFRCGCLELVAADGRRGVLARFRKVQHDKPEACEEEFATLLNRSRRKVGA